MSDKMEFPKTIEAFIGNYSFRDSDEVYTNGAELIPVYRVAQALEYYLPEVKSRAIDEFVGMLEFSLMNNYRHLLKIDADEFEWLTTDAVLTHIRKVKEQLKQIAGEMRGAE